MGFYTGDSLNQIFYKPANYDPYRPSSVWKWVYNSLLYKLINSFSKYSIEIKFISFYLII